MLHPATELRQLGSALGTCVVATEFIPRGTLMWVLDPIDRLIDPAMVISLPPLLRAAVHNHGYFDRDGNIVLCWDHARFVNHSCEPNCLSPGYGFEVAVSDIVPGEPLTNDYLTLNLACDFECACGRASCRRNIHAATADGLVDDWDARIAAALQHATRVGQPLLSLLSPTERRELAAIGGGRLRPRSAAWHLQPEPLRMPA